MDSLLDAPTTSLTPSESRSPSTSRGTSRSLPPASPRDRHASPFLHQRSLSQAAHRLEPDASPAPSLSPESYRAIARRVPRTSTRDLAALCLVCRAFARAVRTVLYAELSVNDAEGGARVCKTLAGNGGGDVARLVRTLSVHIWPKPLRAPLSGAEGSDEGTILLSGDVDVAIDPRSESESQSQSSSPSSEPPSDANADAFWALIRGTLVNTTRLRQLTIDIAPSAPASAYAYAYSSVLGGTNCAFRLRTFHCDFDWDGELVAFLRTQDELKELFVRDYRELQGPQTASATNPSPAIAIEVVPRTPEPAASPSASAQLPPPPPPGPPHPPLVPALTILECAFSETAVLLAPSRPLTRLKTAFSTPSQLAAREPELRLLISALRRRSPGVALRALDIGSSGDGDGDSEAASMQLLQRVAHSQSVGRELRYFGTLVLPVGGRKRLQFYGTLMRLAHLRCVELDVTAWRPAPSSSAALRALAAELRLYCRNVQTMVFVHGDEFARTVVGVDADSGVLRVDAGGGAGAERFWREI